MFDFSNNLHILFMSVLAVLFVVLAINMVALCISKKYTRKFVDVLWSMFLWIVLFVLLIAAALTVIITYVTIPNIKISILSLVISLSSEQFALILGSSIDLTVSFTGEVYTILQLIACQAMVAGCLLLTLIGLILHGNKCKSKKWFSKREKADGENSKQLDGLDEVVIDGAQKDKGLLNQLSDVDFDDNQAVHYETIGQIATKLDKEDVDSATGIADEDMLPQFDEVPSSEDYFNDKFEADTYEEEFDGESLAQDDVDEQIDETPIASESLSSSYFNDDFMLDAQDEPMDEEPYDVQDDDVHVVEMSPIDETQVESTIEQKVVPITKVSINKPRTTANRTPRTKKTSEPRANRRVVRSRDNATKMFAEYLNSKDEKGKQELTNAMEHIDLK